MIDLNRQAQGDDKALTVILTNPTSLAISTSADLIVEIHVRTGIDPAHSSPPQALSPAHPTRSRGVLQRSAPRACQDGRRLPCECVRDVSTTESD